MTILAARLSSQAGDDQILLSQRAAAMVEDVAEVEYIGELQIKGLSPARERQQRGRGGANDHVLTWSAPRRRAE